MDEFPVNKEFPPDFKKYGSRHNGYKNGDLEVIFYYFSVVGYDLELVYKGKSYFFQNDVSGTYQCFGQGGAGKFSGPYGTLYKNANDLLSHFVLDDGMRIIDVLDHIEHAEPY